MQIVVSSHLLNSLPERLGALARGEVCIVADAHTRDALGRDVCKNIAQSTRGSMRLLRTPKASLKQGDALAKHFKDIGFAIAIGSGTINDLVKYAAHKAGVPYAVVSTAPSMNGYTSATASLLKGALKQSFAATAPVAVFADMSVLARSPMELRAAGMGDTLCRPTVQADWRLAYKVMGEDYDDSYFTALLPLEKELLRFPERVGAGDEGMMKILFQALIASGDAMRIHGSSMPASQGEHMIAHMMEYLGAYSYAYHGEEIAVTCLTMTRLQESLLGGNAHLRPLKMSKESLKLLPESCHAAFAKKHITEAMCAQFETQWPSISEWIAEISAKAYPLELALNKAGCRTSPEAIGWKRDTYRKATRLACLTRDRFTFLDLAAMNGLF